MFVDAIATTYWLTANLNIHPFLYFPWEATDWLGSSYRTMKYHNQRCKKIELQDTGSTPRKICRDSHSIRKSSTVGPILQARKPVIIYIRPSKVIHADPRDFMALVQRLTGSSPCEKTTVKREAEVQVLHPSSHDQSQSMRNWSSPCEKTTVKREAEVQVLHPSSHDQSQSTRNLCLDENVNNISPLVVDAVDELGMGADNMFLLEWADLCGTGAHFQPFISPPPHVRHLDPTISDLSMSSSTNIEAFNGLQNVM